MKLSELKPTLSVEEARELFKEIKLTHQISQYKINGLVRCGITAAGRTTTFLIESKELL